MPSLGNDLRTVRKKQDLSIQDVQKSTRIPSNILQSIEDGSIFETMQNNITYTRSYVRSYAKAVGIKEAAIVKALDSVEQGNYNGSLLAEEDAEPIDNEQELDSEPKSDTNEESTGQEKTEQKEKTIPVSSSTSESSSQDWDWRQVNRQSTPPSKRTGKMGLLAIILIIALLAGGFFIYSYYYAESPAEDPTVETTETQQPNTPSDSLREALLTTNSRPDSGNNQTTQPGNTLPDTLSIALYAANGKLEPVRVFTDILNQQNPYWVAQDDTIRFNFVNTVRLRAVNQYDRLQLLYNGHLIQNYYQEYFNSESGMVELDRSVFENHPEWLQPAE